MSLSNIQSSVLSQYPIWAAVTTSPYYSDISFNVSGYRLNYNLFKCKNYWFPLPEIYDPAVDSDTSNNSAIWPFEKSILFQNVTGILDFQQWTSGTLDYTCQGISSVDKIYVIFGYQNQYDYYLWSIQCSGPDRGALLLQYIGDTTVDLVDISGSLETFNNGLTLTVGIQFNPEYPLTINCYINKKIKCTHTINRHHYQGGYFGIGAKGWLQLTHLESNDQWLRVNDFKDNSGDNNDNGNRVNKFILQAQEKRKI